MCVYIPRIRASADPGSRDSGTPATATIPTIVGTFRKVNIFFERGVIAVSIDGIQVLYYKESTRLCQKAPKSATSVVNVRLPRLRRDLRMGSISRDIVNFTPRRESGMFTEMASLVPPDKMLI